MEDLKWFKQFGKCVHVFNENQHSANTKEEKINYYTGIILTQGKSYFIPDKTFTNYLVWSVS